MQFPSIQNQLWFQYRQPPYVDRIEYQYTFDFEFINKPDIKTGNLLTFTIIEPALLPVSAVLDLYFEYLRSMKI